MHLKPSSVDARSPGQIGKLHVSVVTETFPPEVNGVANSLSKVVLGMRLKGHHIQVCRPRQQEDSRRLGDLDVHQQLVPSVPFPLYPSVRLAWPAVGRLMRLWRSTRPDAVHIATEGPLGWAALVAARQLNLPVTSDFRTNFHDYSRHYRAGWLSTVVMRYLRYFHNQCHVTMVPTQSLRQQLEALGFNRLRVVARGVDTHQFTPLRRSSFLRDAWSASPTTRVLIYVGRLAQEKNLTVLVDVYRRLNAAGIQTRWVIVGDGPMKTQLQRELPDAVFPGEQRGEDLARHYASADLFVFPSLTETFGNVTLEAMASGLAVIAFDAAAAADLIVNHSNGWLVEPNDEERFMQTVLHALSLPQEAFDQVRTQARLKVGSQGWDGITTDFESCIRAAMLDSPTTDYKRRSNAPI